MRDKPIGHLANKGVLVAAVPQSIWAFASHAERWVFESQQRRTKLKQIVTDPLHNAKKKMIRVTEGMLSITNLTTQ